MKNFLIAIVASGLSLATLTSVEASVNTQALAGEIFGLVNAERIKMNLPALTFDQSLSRAAAAKAEDMMLHGYFDHTSPSGKEFHKWIDETGYEYSIAGENLAFNAYTIDTGKIIASWMASPGHRQNILSERFQEAGIGAAYGTFEGKNTLLVVQTLASPKGASQSAPVSPAASPKKPIKEKLPIAKPDALSKITSFHRSKEVIGGVALETSAATSIPELVKGESSSKSVWTTLVEKVIQLIDAVFR